MSTNSDGVRPDAATTSSTSSTAPSSSSSNASTSAPSASTADPVASSTTATSPPGVVPSSAAVPPSTSTSLSEVAPPPVALATNSPSASTTDTASSSSAVSCATALPTQQKAAAKRPASAHEDDDGPSSSRAARLSLSSKKAKQDTDTIDWSHLLFRPSSSSVQKEWHAQLTLDMRCEWLFRVAREIFPHLDSDNMRDPTFKNTFEMAREREKEAFDRADDKAEYDSRLEIVLVKIRNIWKRASTQMNFSLSRIYPAYRHQELNIE